MLPESFMQELKARCDIADIVSGYVHLKRKGRNLVGLCPFHSEKTPSFNIYSESGSFYCFGCNAGGDVITFIRKIENLDYIEAVKFLAQRAGLEVPLDGKEDTLIKQKSRIYEANRAAARFYHEMLCAPCGASAIQYLRKRGLSEHTIRHFGLGYAPESRFALVDELKKKGYTDEELVAANLAFFSRKQNLVDRFAGRVMFPIIDLRGNVIAFGGRILTDEKPKYLNTAETPVFQKNSNLFALNFAKKAGKEQLILAEGYMDVIALHQAGFESAVATLGTALTKEQVSIIARYAKEVIIAYDSDEAGQKATKRAISMFRNTGILIRVLNLPSGKDPDEFFRKFAEQGPARFKKLLEDSKNDIEYSLQKIKSNVDIGSPDGKLQYLMEAVKILAGLSNQIEKDIYASRLSDEVNVAKSSIMMQIDKLSRKKLKSQKTQQFREIQKNTAAYNDKINPEKSKNLRAAHAEEALIAYMLNNPATIAKIKDKLPPEKFCTSFHRRVYEEIIKKADSKSIITLTDISQSFSVDEMSRIAKILSAYVSSEHQNEAAKEYIDVILYESSKIAAQKIENADADEIKKYMEKLKEIKK